MNNTGLHRIANNHRSRMVAISLAFTLMIVGVLGAKFAFAETEQSFRDKIANAQSGDTVTLDEDITVNEAITVDKGITIDLNGHTITATADLIDHVLHLTTTENVTVKNGTFEGSATTNAKAIMGRGDDKNKVTTLENLTVQNFTANPTTLMIYGNGGGVALYYGSAVVRDCTFKNNTMIYFRGRGGGLCLSSVQDVTVENCVFDGNTTPYLGGGLAISNVRGTVSVKGNTITNNTASRENRRTVGGGLAIINPYNSNITIEDNVISYNTAESIESGSAIGGGVGLNSNYADGDNATIVFRNNTITYNQAVGVSGNGGGISDYLGDIDDASHSEISIESGVIAHNSAPWGGGVGNIIKRSGDVKFYNVVIRDNSAIRGGGVWSCPTSKTTFNVTAGAAVYDNTATGGPLKNGALSSGDELRYEAPDSDIRDIINGASDQSFATVAPRALGGGTISWYADDPSDRYESGDNTVDVETDYNHRQSSFGLHGELSESDIENAESAAKLFIYDNTAEVFGGGIATNSPIIFGEDAESTLTVQKIWQDEAGNELTESTDEITIPDQVEITLVRVSEDGTEADLETVTLNRDNEWSHTFDNLDANFSYKVKESSVNGFNVIYGEVTAVENDTNGTDYSTVVVNQKAPKENDDEEDSEDETPDESDEEDDSSVVNTGDSANIIIPIIVLVVAIGSLATLLVVRRKASGR